VDYLSLGLFYNPLSLDMAIPGLDGVEHMVGDVGISISRRR